MLSAGWGSLAPKPAFPGSWPVSTQILTWGRNLEPKRGREAAPFKFEIWAPSKDLWKRARTPENAGFGARDPQPADKIGFLLGVGVPYGAPDAGIAAARGKSYEGQT